MKMHRLLEASHFERLKHDFGDAVRKRLEWVLNPQGSPQAAYRSLCEFSMDLGCIALILGEGDEAALKHFDAAAEYAVKWLESPAVPGGPRVYDVQAKASESSVEVTAIHEIPPRRSEAKMSIIGYWKILTVVASFGDRGAMETVARCPEADYSSPDVVTEPSDFERLRAWKAWIRGDERTASKEATAALRSVRDPWPRAMLSALLSIMTKNGSFHGHIDEQVKCHKKAYQRQPNMPEGFISLGGLALCRLAFDQGIRVEDGPYLPVRLLPNYRAAAKAAVH